MPLAYRTDDSWAQFPANAPDGEAVAVACDAADRVYVYCIIVGPDGKPTTDPKVFYATSPGHNPAHRRTQRIRARERVRNPRRRANGRRRPQSPRRSRRQRHINLVQDTRFSEVLKQLRAQLAETIKPISAH